jgi:hypothetical protein
VCATIAPSLNVPSPKFQAYLVIVPSESVESSALKVHIRPAHSRVDNATGGVLLKLVIVTVCCWLRVAPPLSVTTNVVVNVPTAAYR